MIEMSYKQKFQYLNPWMGEILNTVKKDLKNDHLRKDPVFTQKYFSKKLIDKVSKMAKEGKSLSQIADELRTPENASWAPQDERLEEYIDAAYRSVVKGN